MMLTLVGFVAASATPALATYGTIWTGQPMVLSNPRTGLVVDVANASKDSPARVQTSPFKGKGNQLWRFVYYQSVNGVNYWYAVAQHSGRCLDVQWGSVQPAAPVWQWTCNYGSAQLWTVDNSGAVDQFGVPTMRLRNKGSNMCLTVPNPTFPAGAELEQFPCANGNGAQEWQFTHPIVSIANSIVPTGGPTSLNTVNPRPFVGAPWQGFQPFRSGSGSQFNILDGRGGCLRPIGPFYYLPGAPLAPWPCSGSAIELWHAQWRGSDPLGLPVWQIVNSWSGDCLDFDGNYAPEQTALRLWPCGNIWTQSWYLYT